MSSNEKPAIGEGSRVPSPHEYAMEYEFRGDGDYTPTDAERTMIEDAICGYLGEVSALRSPPERRDAPEPVAWHCVGSGDGWAEDKITRDRETAEDYARRPHQWRVTPLYASPPDGELVRMRQVLRRVEEHLSEYCEALGVDRAPRSLALLTDVRAALSTKEAE